jgi:predicted homoserine dehydrogenase-like protein
MNVTVVMLYYVMCNQGVVDYAFVQIERPLIFKKIRFQRLLMIKHKLTELTKPDSYVFLYFAINFAQLEVPI